MLSNEECRRLLGSPPLSDEEVAEIRDTLQEFAVTLVDGVVTSRTGTGHPYATRTGPHRSAVAASPRSMNPVSLVDSGGSPGLRPAEAPADGGQTAVQLQPGGRQRRTAVVRPGAADG